MFNSVVSWVLERAPQYELQEAMRWLSGSLNSSHWSDVLPVAGALLVAGPVLLAQARNLDGLQLGDDTAMALGIRAERTRVLAIVAAVGLIAFATAAAGPIAFVAFLSGPIAARIVGPRGSLLVPAALVGALLRSEEHTSELQSRGHLVCRLLLEKKKMHNQRSRCNSH